MASDTSLKWTFKKLWLIFWWNIKAHLKILSKQSFPNYIFDWGQAASHFSTKPRQYTLKNWTYKRINTPSCLLPNQHERDFQKCVPESLCSLIFLGFRKKSYLLQNYISYVDITVKFLNWSVNILKSSHFEFLAW